MKGHWVADSTAFECEHCVLPFTFSRRRHHCRDCGGVFCERCTQQRRKLVYRDVSDAERVCGACAGFADMYAEVFEGKAGGGEHTVERRMLSGSEDTGWFDAAAYEANFARPSAVGIRRRNQSSDDVAAQGNFSVFQEVTMNDWRARAVASRGFPKARALWQHADIATMIFAPPPASMGSPGLENMKASLATALLEAKGPPPPPPPANDDMASNSSLVPGMCQPPHFLQVADFASYY
jgi:hypothetical protein